MRAEKAKESMDARIVQMVQAMSAITKARGPTTKNTERAGTEPHEDMDTFLGNISIATEVFVNNIFVWVVCMEVCEKELLGFQPPFFKNKRGREAFYFAFFFLIC